MKIEEIVTNLEISKRLKEVGVEQESLFYWKFNQHERDYIVVDKQATLVDHNNEEPADYPVYAAFTASELGELLPAQYVTYRDDWNRYGCENRIGHESRQADTMANAMGKMLIYLLENGLLKEGNE